MTLQQSGLWGGFAELLLLAGEGMGGRISPWEEEETVDVELSDS